GLPFERFAANLEHFLGEIGGAVAGRLTADEGASPAEALAREHGGFVLVLDALVLTKEVADFPPANADIPGGHVAVFAKMAVKLGHEGLAEPHHLGVGAALGIEVGAAFSSAD